MFIKNVIESNNYISSKNQMLIHLSERSIWNLVFKTFKDSIDRKPTNSFAEFIYNLNTEPTMKEQIVEDQEKATLIGIDRLDVFHLSNLKNIEKKYRPDFKRFHKYNLQATNFVGQFALDGLYKKDYVTFSTTDDIDYLKKQNLVNKDTEDGTYMFLLVFPYRKDYPYSMIERIGDAGMKVDNTNPMKYLSEKTYDLLKEGVFVQFMDAGQFVAMFNEDDFEIWKTDRIDLSTPQSRFKFMRRYVSGLSQHELSTIMNKKPYFIDADQKKIAYWEKTTNEIPPFMKKEDMLSNISEIFSRRSREFLGIELRDNVGQDYVSQKNIKNWIYDFIISDPSEKLFNELPDFLWRVMKEDKPVVISNKKKRYEEAVKKFELEERINQQMKYKKDDITTKIMSNWFAILYHMNERELIQDLQLVYDNNDDRSNVYDLYIKMQSQFPAQDEPVVRPQAYEWKTKKKSIAPFEIPDN